MEGKMSYAKWVELGKEFDALAEEYLALWKDSKGKKGKMAKIEKRLNELENILSKQMYH